MCPQLEDPEKVSSELIVEKYGCNVPDAEEGCSSLEFRDRLFKLSEDDKSGFSSSELDALEDQICVEWLENLKDWLFR